MSSAKADALQSIIKDAHTARLGDKIPKDKRERLLGLIREELEEDDKKSEKTDDDEKD